MTQATSLSTRQETKLLIYFLRDATANGAHKKLDNKSVFSVYQILLKAVPHLIEVCFKTHL